ncbi:MAG: FecR family protein [Elusimicrobia bacterium]|nr:FecR family protein [Elusimicrobiota bacterium]
MRLPASLLAVVLCAAAALPPPVSAAKVAAVSTFVQGDVQLQRAGETSFAPLEANTLLRAGDLIKTGDGATAALVSKKGAEIRVNSNTELKMPSGNGVREVFEMAFGQVWSRMLHLKARLSVRTPAAVCAVRGTEADIDQHELLTLKVYEGHVDIQNKNGMQSLHAGQLSTVAGPGAAPAAPRAMQQTEMGDWQKGIAVKDLGKYLDRMGLSGKDLRVKIAKDGQEKDVNVKLKKKP